jgi:hypothetical protein
MAISCRFSTGSCELSTNSAPRSDTLSIVNDRNLPDDSAHTAVKSEAFSAPLCLVDVNAFYDGINTLSVLETRFADGFMRLGRKDLAECVTKGKIWQRIPTIIGQQPDLTLLLTVEELLQGKKSEAKDLREWCDKVRGPYSGHEGLRRLTELK